MIVFPVLVILMVGAGVAREDPEREISTANLLLPVPQCDTCRRVTY